ncbi:MAG: superfamily I DNA and RNA helicase [Halorubrum sp. J07HR59]|nr:MAG: superfamily I DNA and RNA helicase [Halorubrum sp. J07HR59]
MVYAWQGADPDLLLDTPVEEDVVLPNSYRLPSQILNVVNAEIRHIDKRQEKDLNPRKEGGEVQGMDSPSMIELVRSVRSTVENDDGDLMLLFRARYQMFQFIDEFIDQGIPFSLLTDGRMWTDRVTDYVTAIENLDEGQPITGLQARRLADMLQNSAFGTTDRKEFYDFLDDREEAADVEDISTYTIEADTIDDKVPFLPGADSAADMIRKVTSFQRSSIGAYFGGDYEGMNSDRVRVGTIHSAKGREADHVFLATDLTEKVVEQMAATVEDPTDVPGVDEFTKSTSPVPVLTDNERRVFYVGMSRARERLVVMENLVDGAPTLPVSVLLHNEPREGTPDELFDTVQEQLAVPEPEA